MTTNQKFSLNSVIDNFTLDLDPIITKNLQEASKYSNLSIITTLRITRLKEIIDTKQKLFLLKKQVMELLVLKNINLSLKIPT